MGRRHGNPERVDAARRKLPRGFPRPRSHVPRPRPRHYLATMPPGRPPSTAPTRILRAAGVEFEPFLYDYEAKGGTRQFAENFGVAEHLVVKTLIVEDESGRPACVLMHGDHELSLKALARDRGTKRFSLCHPTTARRHSGYLVGGTSPIGLLTSMDILVEETILGLDHIYVNGGARGFLLRLSPTDLASVAPLIPVRVGRGG